MLEVYGRTEVGNVRESNEDVFFVGMNGHYVQSPRPYKDELPERRGRILLGVCDGMGGASAGEVASRKAARAIWESFAWGSTVRLDVALMNAMKIADRVVHRESFRKREWSGMGTTATVVAIDPSGEIAVGQVGDSRAWLRRAGAPLWQQLTKDQTLLQQHLDAGTITPEQAKRWEGRHIVLQSMGSSEKPAKPVIAFSLSNLVLGDTLALTSDGAHEGDWFHEAVKSPKTSDLVGDVVRAALDAGGQDNITCLAARLIK